MTGGGISAEHRGALLEKRRQSFGEVRTIGHAGELLQLLVEVIVQLVDPRRLIQ